MEINGEGLTLGAGTVFAKMAREGRGASGLALDDEPRVMALLATAYERPVENFVIAKLRRACERWTEGDKALAHIHLAHAGLPPCDEKQALRLFVADELINAGTTPAALMMAQGFDPPLNLWKAHFNRDQPRVPAGSGPESGEWSGGEANFTPVAFRSRRGRHGRGGIDSIRSFLDRLRELLKAKEGEPPHEEDAKPENEPPKASPPELEVAAPKPSDFIGQDFGKSGIGVEKPDLDIGEFSRHATRRVDEYGAELSDLQSTVEDPLVVLKQSDGRFLFLSETAVVILDRSGKVITIYTAPQFDTEIRQILDYVLRGRKK